MLNPDDPRIGIWETVCSKREELIASIERRPDAQELEYQEQVMLENLERCGAVQFGEDSSLTADEEVIREHYTRLEQTAKQRRERERREFKLEP